MSRQDVENKLSSKLKIKSRNRDKITCYCPLHNDTDASLCITFKRDKVVGHDFGGCDFKDILAYYGLTYADMYYEHSRPPQAQKAPWIGYVEKVTGFKLVARYDYCTLDGHYCYSRFRLIDKDGEKHFVYGIFDSNGKVKLKGVSRSEVIGVYGDLQAIKDSDVVYVCEGEKDTQTMCKQGYKNCFTYGSADDWRQPMSELCRDKDVLILQDNDDSGRKVANQIKADLEGIAKSAIIVTPTPDVEKGDISDYFQDHSKADFEKLIEDSKPIDLLQFCNLDSKGRPVSVIHNSVYEYIKEHEHIIFIGQVPYVYCNGAYLQDMTTAKTKSMIRRLIYPRLRKSTTENSIYNMLATDEDLEKDLSECNRQNADWVNFENGYYSLIDKQMKPHNPCYFTLNQIPHKYEPQAQLTGEKIDKYLSEAFHDKQTLQTLLEYGGYSMTSDTKFQKFVILNGPGGSGKSIILTLLQAVHGYQNCSNVSLEQMSMRFSCIDLMGKTLNSCGELELEAVDNVKNLKMATGGDILRGEPKGKPAVNFKNYAKLIFSTNQLPVIQGEQTNAFYRRVLIIPMNFQPKTINEDLDKELLTELDYFIQLLVKAAEQLYSRGYFIVSEESQRACEQLRADSDTVQSFLDEACTVCDPSIKENRTKKTDLFEKYKAHCENMERKVLSKNGFYKNLRQKQFGEVQEFGTKYFKGIVISKDKKNEVDAAERPTSKQLQLEGENGFMNVDDLDTSDLPFT